MKRILILAIISSLFCLGIARAAVINVPADYTNIHDAVQAAQTGDTVLVAAGTYNDCTHPTEGPESTPACVIMKSGVTLRGAGPELTIIDAQEAGRGIFIEGVSDCSVENLQVTGAYAAIYGAGLLIRQVDSSVEISDVRVTGCTDGGVVTINYSHPVLRRVTMDHNEAKQGGGLAIEEDSNPSVIDCIVDNNEAPSGAGIFIRQNCEPTIDGTVVKNNTINANWGNGGGISVQSSSPTITNCEILNNTTLGYGGGIAFLDNSTGLMEDCLIKGNNASFTYSQGGGVSTQTSSPIFRRVVIAENTASGYYAEGGGLDISFGPAPTLESCTIVGNSTSGNGFGGGIAIQWNANPIIDKCIISGSTAGQGIFCSSATPVVSCTNIFGNAGGDDVCGTDNGGNFSADPLFCGIEGSEYNLNSNSPCAPGNHPGGLCDGELIGAKTAGCGESPAPMPGLQGLTLGNHPNPFNPRTTIFFELPKAGAATLRIYDMAGRLVQIRSWDSLPQGRTEFQWNGLDRQGRAQSSGVYLYRVDTSDESLSQRMSLIR
ncbi:MAG: T9SS type A sorting domain-containing protein [bacterium]|nr:T9SS type A sorting domain-containing protein [bacterium]